MLSNSIVWDLGDWTGLRVDILDIIHDIRYLTFQMTGRDHQIEVSKLVAGRPVTAESMMAFSDTRAMLEYRTLALPDFYKPKHLMQYGDYLHEACRVAVLIYINRVLRSIHPNSSVLKTLKAQLISIIQEWEEAGLGIGAQPQPGSLIWILFMGGILFLNVLEETWFAERIARTTSEWGLETWQETKGLLLRIAWVDSLSTPSCSSLWRRVENIRYEDFDRGLPYFSFE